MSFDQQKETAIARMNEFDHSKKGSVDDNIKELISMINNHPDFYTTSSCGGRLLIVDKKEDAKKNELNWLYSEHDPQKIEEKKIFESLKKAQHDVWLSAEAVILHIAARAKEKAHELLKCAQSAGIKRGGAISMGERIVLEIIGVDELSAPVLKEGKLVVSEEYVRILISESKKKLMRNNARIQQFQANFQTNLSFEEGES